VVERIRFALERFASPRHRSHVAPSPLGYAATSLLFSLGPRLKRQILQHLHFAFEDELNRIRIEADINRATVLVMFP
jgi:hypothetical protein